MLYFGESLLQVTPTPCDNSDACDCPVHGFGIEVERSMQIHDALFEHAKSCLNKEDKSFDFGRLVAGPNTLDLLSPTEVFFAAWVLRGFHSAAVKVMEKAASQHLLSDLMHMMEDDASNVIVLSEDDLAKAPQAVRDIIDAIRGKDTTNDTESAA